MKQWMAAVALAGVAINGWAGTSVDDLVETTSEPSIDIQVDTGEIKVRVWDRDAVKLEGFIDAAAEDYEFRAQSQNSVRIRVERKDRSGYYRTDGVDTRLTVTVPRHSAVTFDSINATFDLEDLEGAVVSETVDGSLQVRSVRGAVTVGTINGTVRLEGISGNIDVESVSGRVWIDQVGGDRLDVESMNGRLELKTTANRIDVETVSGDVEIAAGDVEHANLTAVSGDVRAVMHLVHQAGLSAETVSGDFELGLRKPHDLRVDAETFSGDIDNGISDDRAARRAHGPGESLEFSVGTGSARIQAVTLSGDITLKSD